MTTQKYLFMALALCVMALALQRKALNKAKSERDRYRNNTEALLEDVTKYKVNDSLNAAKVGILELTLKEFKKYRKEDNELIKELQTKNRELSQYIGTGTTTEVHIVTEVHDTTFLKDSVYIPMKCFDYRDKWVAMNGCFIGKEFTGDILVKDSLVIVETIKRKRFLGFLWKTKKIKNRQLDIVSKNPYTSIDDISVVRIKD